MESFEKRGTASTRSTPDGWLERNLKSMYRREERGDLASRHRTNDRARFVSKLERKLIRRRKRRRSSDLLSRPDTRTSSFVSRCMPSLSSSPLLSRERRSRYRFESPRVKKHKFTCHERNWFDPVANNPEKYRASPQQSRLFFSRGFAKGTRAQIFFLFPFLSLSLFFFEQRFQTSFKHIDR